MARIFDRKRARTALAALAFGVAASGANVAGAAIIQVEIATTLSQVFSLQHTSLPMAVGDPVVLTFDYDTSKPDLNPVAGSGQFQNAVTEATVEFPDQGLSFQFGPGGFSILVTIDNTGTAPILIDSFGFNSLGDSVGGGTLQGDTPNSLVFGFAQAGIGVVPTLVVDDVINPPFSFDGLGSSEISLIGPIGTTGENFVDIFGLNAGTATILPLPEPGLASLLAVAALGAAGLPRRR